MTLYDDLGLPHDASANDIQKAYRKKAMEAHPDKGGDKKVFQQIAIAYKILKDPESRERYDRTGSIDKPESKKDALFRQLTVEGFTRSDRPIETVIKKLQRDRLEMQTELNAAKSSKEKLERRLKKFLLKHNNEIIKETIEGTIANIETHIKTYNENLDMIKDLINDFEAYKEEDDTPTLMPDFESFIKLYGTSTK